ncbi:MAG: hypothetical protein LAO24_07940 [Acidobacteriia bacterium]|nr:hypothetical protein [Terriglobia bacterium]
MTRNRAGKIVTVLTLAALTLMASRCGGGQNGSQQPPPPPAITVGALVPSYTVAGGNDFNFFVNGSGFTTASVVQWNGTPVPTTFGTNAILTASVSTSLIATPGMASITVKDSSSGATSNAEPFGIASPAAATAGVIAMITVAADGTPPNGDSLVAPSISATGRYVSFQSNATNLAPGPASGYQEIYERDTCIGAPAGCVPTTIRITVTHDGSPVNFHSLDSAISADGRYVAFDSEATNILPNTDVCGSFCVFLRDTCNGAPAGCNPNTTLVTVASDGSPVGSANPSISPDGRFVAFNSFSANIVSGNGGGVGQAFVRDTCNGAPSGCTPGNTLISVPSSGTEDNATTGLPAISATARYFAFQSWATNILPNEAGLPGNFWRDTCIGGPPACIPTTTRADVTANGAQPNNGIFSGTIPAITRDGRLVAFASTATNLVSANVNGIGNVYVRDTCTGAPASCTATTSLVSLANDGSVGNCGSPSQGLAMSSNGRFVAFDSIATNLTPDDNFPACSFEDVFVRDSCFGVASGCTPSTVRVSVTDTPNPQTPGFDFSRLPAISGDGHYVVFLSAATNLIPGGTNGHQMVLLAKTGF